MKRILLLATVAVMLAAMMATAGPASATVHRLTCGDDKAQAQLDTTPSPVEDVMDAPGISDDDDDAVVDNGTNAPEGQPVDSVLDTANDNAAKNAIDKKDAGEKNGCEGE